MQKFKKMMALLLAVVLLAGVFPAQAFAANTYTERTRKQFMMMSSYDGSGQSAGGIVGWFPYTTISGDSLKTLTFQSINVHTLEGNSTSFSVFCIQPDKAASYGYDEVDSMYPWSSWSTEVKEMAAKAMYWGYPNYTESGVDANVQQAAVQAMIFDIACGFVVKSNGSYVNVSKSKKLSASETMVTYGFADATYGVGDSGVRAAHARLLERMNTPMADIGVPTYATEDGSAFNYLQLEYDNASGLYTGTFTDTSGNYKYYNFASDANGITITQSGANITISVTPDAVLANGFNDPANTTKIKLTTSSEPNRDFDVNNVEVFGGARNTQTMVRYPKGNPDDEYVKAHLALKVEDLAGLKLQKVSSDTGVTNGNSCYSLEGAEYAVYASEANATAGTNSLATLTTDATGVSNTVQLPAAISTYYVKETKAPDGYALDETVYSVAVTRNETATLNVTDPPIMDPVVMLLRKADAANTAEGKTSGNMSLAGAQYTVEFYPGYYDTAAAAEASGNPERSWVVETDEDGYASLTEDYFVSGDDFYLVGDIPMFPLGTVVIYESLAPEGYLLSSEKTAIKITEDGTDSASVQTYNAPIMTEQAKMGGVILHKEDADKSDTLTKQGNATLAGAEFTIYNANEKEVTVNGVECAPGEAVATMTTDAQGIARSTKILPYGLYTVKETKAPAGYQLNSDWSYEVDIDAENVIINAGGCVDEVIRGGLSVQKIDAGLETDTPYGDASFAGVVFSISNASENPVVVNGTEYAVGAEIMRITTDADGFATTDEDILPYGSYTVREVSVPENGGYALNENYVATVTVAEANTIVEADPCPNEGNIFGGLSIQKIDAGLKTNKAQGDADLSGAVFEIVNKSNYAVIVNGRTYAVDAVVAEITTDANGLAVSDMNLPMGTYAVREKTPSAGYTNNDTYEEEVSIREDGVLIALEDSTACPEDIIRGGLSVQKLDKDTGENHGPGGISLANAEITIINRSESAVIVNDQKIEPYDGEFDRQDRDADGIVMRIYTDGNGVATTGENDLPYGTYEVFETKAPSGYMIGTYDDTELWHKTVEIREDGVIVAIDGDDAVVDEMARLDARFIKVGFRGNNQVFLSNVAFLMERIDENGEVVESHILVTDPNGSYDSASYPHSNNTNGNDAAFDADAYAAYLDGGDGDAVIDESKLDYHYGTWFGGGEVIDSLPDGSRSGAFIAYPNEGTEADWTKNYYRLTELPCTANEGYVISEPINLKIYKSTTNSQESYFIGMIHNTAPTMSTVLIGNDTQSHQVQSTGVISVTDTVTYDGLKAGKTYILRGVLMDKDTEEPLLVNGEKVESYKMFKASSSKGSEEVTFTFDSTGLDGKSLVSFQYLYLSNTLISSHEDINDTLQTVTFAGIRTVASGADGEKEILVSDNMTVNDVVYYENLATGYNYVIEGTLLDAETGEALKDANGNAITAKANLPMADPESPRSGSVTVTFNFKGSEALLGKTAVACEKVLVNGSTVLAEHKDLADEDQTVFFPMISTILVNGSGMDIMLADGTITLTDNVHYAGLQSGEPHTLSGVLMDKATGKALKDANGDDIAASTTFTPDASEGETTLEFTFEADSVFDEAGEAVDLTGRALVAFDTLSNSSGVVAEDKDIDNESQTVHFPKITTSAHDIDGNKEIMAGSEIKIVDEITYSELKVPTGEAGDEGPNVYTITGKLMDKETGEAFLDAEGEEITATAELSIAAGQASSGTVTVEFEVNDVELAGKTLVAFEQLAIDGNIVATHEDIDDEDQSVHFPAIDTVLVDEAEHHIAAVGTTTFIDHVSYTNLIPGTEYTLNGSLWTRTESGSAALKDDNSDQYVAQATFTPDEANGTTDVVFTVDSSDLGGKIIVAYETLSKDGCELVKHEDISDDDQSVRFPTIDTIAKGADGSKVIKIKHGEDMAVEDIVHYENLIPGESYSLSGILRVKSTGAPVRLEGSEDAFVSEITFTPSEASGDVPVIFSLPFDNVQGLELVACQTLLYDGSTVAVHDELEDSDQMVYVPYDVPVFKYDASDRTPIEGAEFAVKDVTSGVTGAETQTVSSGADGYLYFTGLPGHTYEITEITVPEGYRTAADSYTVTIAEDGTASGDVEIPNIRGGTIVLTKVDLVTGDPVEGCEITIYKVNEDKSRTEVFTQVTDKNGRIYFYTTDVGKFVYKETKTRTGYYLNNDEYTFTIEDDLTVTGTVRFKNVPFGTVVLTKVDKSGKPLQGAEFSIYDETTGKFLGKGVSGANGRVYFVSPGPGKYYFVETKAPKGYTANSNRNHFEIASDYTISGKVVLVNGRTGTNTSTGDENNVAMWIGIASVTMLAAAGAMFFIVRKPRKKEEPDIETNR